MVVINTDSGLIDMEKSPSDPDAVIPGVLHRERERTPGRDAKQEGNTMGGGDDMPLTHVE